MQPMKSTPKKVCAFYILFVFCFFFISDFVHAKRKAPPPPQSIEYNGIRYLAPNDNGRLGYLQVWDAKTNSLLYSVNVFINHINPRLEECVQHVYISKLQIEKDWLVVTDERNRKQYFDIATFSASETEHYTNHIETNQIHKNKKKIKKKTVAKKQPSAKKSAAKKPGGAKKKNR
jgi:hypothetical protein